jgi:hypothetical protein
MSSTTGVQNLLVNVFRPVYRYDPAEVNPIFVPKLEMSNIDNYSGNTLSVFNVAVGDSASNVYVGSNAGNPYTNIRGSSNNTAIGWAAGSNISNVCNATYLGLGAGANAAGATDVIAVGTNSVGGGTSNIFVGNSSGSVGTGNIFVGHGIAPGNVSNTLQIGTTIFGNLSTKWIGIGTPTATDTSNRLDVSGNTYIGGQVGIKIIPGNRTLDVNGDFRASDGVSNVLNFQQGVTTSTGGFASARGSIFSSGSATTIGQIKKGVFMVVVVQTGAPANRATISYLAGDGTDTNTTSFNFEANVGSTLNFSLSGGDIQFSNSGFPGTFDYSITYFPLP